MVPIDHYIGSSLKYIIVNVIRRVTVRGFGRAVLDPPYQDNGKCIQTCLRLLFFSRFKLHEIYDDVLFNVYEW